MLFNPSNILPIMGSYLGRVWAKFTSLGKETDSDLVLSPKGNGGILAQAPDGTTTGGNARGFKAVDFQMDRQQIYQVAAMNLSFLGGGSANSIKPRTYTTNPYGAVLVGGVGNTTTARSGFSGGGENNLNNSQYGVLCGGKNNSIVCIDSATANGGLCVIGGGYTNNLSEVYESVICGGTGNAIKGRADVSNSSSAGNFIGGGSNNYLGSNPNTNATSANIAYLTIVGGSANKIYEGIYNIIGAGYNNSIGNAASPTGTGLKSNVIVCGSYGVITNANYSVICGGGDGTSTNGNSITGGSGNFIGAGYKNTIAGTALNSSILCGYSNSNSGNNSTIISGHANTIGSSALDSGIVGGLSNIINGASCATVGSTSATLEGSTSVALASNSVTLNVNTQRVAVVASQNCIASLGSDSSTILSSLNSTVSHTNVTILSGFGVTSKTSFSTGSGFSNGQNHRASFYFKGTLVANTATALTASTTNNISASTVLVVPLNSAIVGKLNIVVKKVGTAETSAWLGADIIITRNGSSSPVISLYSVGTEFPMFPSISFSVVASSTVPNGIEFRITDTVAHTVTAKATFDYELVMD